MRRNSSTAALAARTAHGRVQTAKLRRGVQMFRATRSSADTRQITTILQQVLSSERRDQPPTRSALLTSNWRGCDYIFGAIRHPAVEQAALLQILNEERQLPERRDRRRGVPLNVHAAAKGIGDRRPLLYLRLLARRVRDALTQICFHTGPMRRFGVSAQPPNCRISVQSSLPAAAIVAAPADSSAGGR